MQKKVNVADILKLIILYSIAVSLGQFFFQLPGFLYYANDLLLLIAVACCAVHIFQYKITTIPKAITYIFTLLFMITIIGFVLNFSKPTYFLWGVRNNYRAFAYFFACCICMQKKDVDQLCSILMKLLPVNVVLCTFQYYMAINSGDANILKFVGDHVGGIFGSTTGCNRILNIYIVFIYTWALSLFLKNEITRKRFLYLFLCCIYISYLSELKVIVVELLLTSLMLIHLETKGVKKVVVFLLIVTSLMVFINIWSMFNADLAKMIRSIEAFINYSSASTYGAKSSNRFTVMPRVYKLFLDGDMLKTIFGIGMGNAETSNFAFLTTPIFHRYEYIKYHLFHSGFLLLETGVLGMLLYISYFVVNYFVFLRYHRTKVDMDALVYVGGIFNIIAVLCLFYNTTLRSEISNYLIFFILSIPIIYNKHTVDLSDRWKTMT